MRVGIVCPYAWDSPGGVVTHIIDLSHALQRAGHEVSVLAPCEDESILPAFVESCGAPRAVPYNGSVAKLAFGPKVARRVGKWIENGDFDVLHVHEPLAPSASVLACWAAKGPIVATWHMSFNRSRMLMGLGRLAHTAMEKITATIAVSEAARATMVRHIGGDAVIVPNGVDTSRYAGAQPLPGYPGVGGAVVFLGRVDESRKGLQVLVQAWPAIRRELPQLRLVVAGPGDATDLLADLDAQDAAAITLMGRVSEELKPSVFASGNVYLAPNTGGESFGIVLLEAMATGVPVLASDIEAFARVLDFGKYGALFANEDSVDLATQLVALMRDPTQRAQLAVAGKERAAEFDWSAVARRVVDVYESVRVPGVKVHRDMSGQILGWVAGR